jgi:hypothetical protein
MKTEEIIAKLKSRKGQFGRAVWEKSLKTRKDYRDMSIRKRTTMVCRAGINYDNMTIVKEKRDSGMLPPVNAGLPAWQEWDEFPYLLQKKDEPSKKYIRLYPTNNLETLYFKNGKLSSLDEIREFVLASELPKGEKPDCISVGLDNVIELV